MFSRILVPVDTSYDNFEWLKAPLDIALEFSEKSLGKILLIGVIPDNLLKGYYPNIYSPEIAASALRKLETIRDALLPATARVELHIREGGICTEILKVARESNCNLIVIASHGPLTRDYLLGSNASYIALHSSCSVFVVR
jgi:nucleotide-binding universal stress UspA family protein